MKSNFLKLNDKTEFMLFGSHHQLSKINIDFIHIGDLTLIWNDVTDLWHLYTFYFSIIVIFHLKNEKLQYLRY